MLNYQRVKRPRVGTVKLRMEGGFKALLQRLEAEKWLRENVAPWRPVAPTGGIDWGHMGTGRHHGVILIWQCVKTNSTPSVHIKIAGIYGCE
jgi:hypothetical protein